MIIVSIIDNDDDDIDDNGIYDDDHDDHDDHDMVYLSSRFSFYLSIFLSILSICPPIYL